MLLHSKDYSRLLSSAFLLTQLSFLLKIKTADLECLIRVKIVLLSYTNNICVCREMIGMHVVGHGLNSSS